MTITLLGALITGAYYKQLVITLPACGFTDGLEGPEIGADAITAEPSFEAYYDSVTGKQVEVAAQNTISDITG